MPQLLLDVAIATWKPDGLNRVESMHLPQVDGVRYVVSWQAHGDTPEIPNAVAARSDIEVHLFDGKGVSANRNNALAHCVAPLVLMADDDLSYTHTQLGTVIDTFRRNPHVDVATFKYDGARKTYPEHECTLLFPLPKNYGVATFEIAVRMQVLKKGLKFDERFGPGAPVWQAAEDEKFLLDARRQGFNCRFFPVAVTTHRDLTTGDKPMTSSGVAAASGRIIRMEYPATWPARVLLKSLRQRKAGGRFFFTLFHQLRGAFA